MPFQWSVQPYQFKKNLVEHYTNAMMVAGRKKAFENAIEAEQWMKDNAPWKDRTPDERLIEVTRAERRRHVEGEDGPRIKERQRSNVPYLLGARAGLRVVVTDDATDEMNQGIQDIEREMKEAQKELNQANAERKRNRKRAEGMLKGQFENRYGARGDWSKEVTKEFNAALRELAGSGITRFDKAPFEARKSDLLQEYKQRIPIATLHFQHNERVHYAVWLEIAMGQRYAIISKAVERYSGKFFNQLRRLANLKQYREQVAFGTTTTPQQTYQQHVAEKEAQWARNGTPRAYEPWNEDRRLRRKARKPEYSYDNYRQWIETGMGKRERARYAELEAQQERERSAHTRSQRNAASNVRTLDLFGSSRTRR